MVSTRYWLSDCNRQLYVSSPWPFTNHSHTSSPCLAFGLEVYATSELSMLWLVPHKPLPCILLAKYVMRIHRLGNTCLVILYNLCRSISMKGLSDSI